MHRAWIALSLLAFLFVACDRLYDPGKSDVNDRQQEKTSRNQIDRDFAIIPVESIDEDDDLIP